MEGLKAKKIAWLALAASIIGLSLLTYALKRITDYGIYADRTHSSGLIPLSDALLGGIAILLIGCSIGLLLLIRKVNKRYELKEPARTRLNDFALFGVVFATLSIFVYWFSLPAVVFGVSTIALTYYKDNREDTNHVFYRMFSAFTVVASIVNVIIVFTTR
ncbi:MAG TPA: hypothetical protein VLF69_05610 [Candidatus Saccharimonadales bacterium]|nr:hypothetical protein [Candidatus Saccharimonadales bacterium]